MYQNNIKHILWMIVFILLQIIIFNNINFLGGINPYFYIVFILLLPVNMNRYILLMYAFAISFPIDLIENTGGINTMVTLFIAFLRNPLIYLLDNGSHSEKEEIKLNDFSVMQWFIYLTFFILLHHFLIDMLESMKWEMALSILIRSLWGTLITLILAISYLYFFPIKNKAESL